MRSSLARLQTALARIRGFLRPAAVEAETEQELEAHLAVAEDDLVRRGMTREEARRAARMELGGVAQVREASRAARGIPLLDTFWLDITLGVRMLRKTWGLTLVGGLALTSAISISVGLFHLSRSINGASVPLDEGDRLVSVVIFGAADQRPSGVELSDLDRWRDSLRSIVSLGGFRTVQRNFQVGDRRVEVVSVAQITGAGFDLARVPPLFGRPIRAEDERAGAEPVIVLGHDVWTVVFAADPAAIGRTARIDGVVHTVIGVMPDGFGFPVNHQYWTPLRREMSGGPDAAGAPVIGIGRLAPGATMAMADAELRAVGLSRPEHRDGDARRPRVMSYVSGVTGVPGNSAAIQSFLFITASLLLLPPCANVAVLIYARTVGRQREFAARYALGGSRARIVTQLFVEAFLLVALATAASLVIVSRAGVHLQALRRAVNPFWLDLGHIPIETMLIAAAIGGLAAVLVGVVPALQAVGRLTDAAALGGRSTLRLGGVWTTLVAAQVALTIAVIPVAGELAWGIVRPHVVGPGFAPEQFLTAGVTFDRIEGTGPVPVELDRRIEALPGVDAVAWSVSVPETEPQAMIDVEGNTQQALVHLGAVEPSFFRVFDMTVAAGRVFDPSGASGQVVVNRALARFIAGNRSPVGWRIRARQPGEGWTGGESWQQIVGVVDDLHASNGRRTVYQPLSGDRRSLSVSLRLASGSPDAAQRLATLGIEVDAGLRISEIRALADVFARDGRLMYIAGLMLGSGSLSVLLLASAGIYAFMAFTVARQRREIGIRSALGGRSARLLAGILGRAGRQLGLGAAAGCALAVWLGEYLPIEQIGGIRLPGLIPAAVLVVAIAGLAATAGPALRALRLQPTDVLRDN